MREFQMIKIKDLCNKVSVGYVGTTTPYFTTKENGVPFLRSKNIRLGRIDMNDLAYVTLEFHKKNKKSHLQKGDVVIVRVGQNRGDVCKISDEFVEMNVANCVFLRPKHEYSNYLEILLRSQYGQKLLLSISTGSAQEVLNTGAIAELELPIPNLEIVNYTSKSINAFDSKIELLKAQNVTLEETAKTIFKEWFGSYQIGTMTDLPANGELPEGWRVGKLGDEFNITIGRTPPRIEQEWFSKIPTGKKWISIKDIGNTGTFIFSTSEYLTDSAIKKFNIPIIPANTVILSFKMTVGKLTITTEEMLSNEAIAHLKLKGETKLSSEYIYLCLQNLDFNSLGSTSSIVTAINSTMIKNLEFIIPKKESLISFHEIIKPIFLKIKLNTEQIQTLTQTRDTLLPNLMSGELRVKDLNE